MKPRVIDLERINKANATIKRFRETVSLESLTQGEQIAVACAFEDFAEKLEGIMAQRVKKTVSADDELAKVFIETFAKQLAMAVAEGKTNTDAED